MFYSASSCLTQRLQGESNPKNISVKYNPHEDGGSGFPIDPPRGFGKNGSSHSSSMVHPSAVGGYLWAKKAKEHEGNNFPVRTIGSSGHRSDLRRQTSYMPQETTASNAYSKQDDRMSAKDSRVCFFFRLSFINLNMNLKCECSA